MDKTVYFLGAGATKAVCDNAPVNKNLVRKALEHNSGLSETENLQIFINDLFKTRNDPPIDNQIWNLLDYIIQQNRSASPKYNLEQINKLRADLVNLVIKEFKKSLVDADIEYYGRFVSKICLANAAIISTNYDILIDNALFNSSYNYGAKLRRMVTSIRIDPESGLKRPSPEGYGGGLKLNEGKIPLLKIHGSLNWLYCPKCNEVDITVRGKGAEELADSDCYCFNKNCTSKYESLLITPTMYKNYENRIIKEIWNCAEHQLIDADSLVFVGYALKDEDYEIRCLLMKAMLSRSDGYKKVTVIERKPETNNDTAELKIIKEKYEALYGEIEFKEKGFLDYIDSL